MKTHFRNLQWAVTDYGLELLDDSVIGGYAIDTARLLEQRRYVGELIYSWPVHMAEKTWVDVDAFNTAFEKALKHHHATVNDSELMATTMKVAAAVGKNRVTPAAV